MTGVVRRIRDVVSAFLVEGYLNTHKQHANIDRYAELQALEDVDVSYYWVYILVGSNAKSVQQWVRGSFARSAAARLLSNLVRFAAILVPVALLLWWTYGRLTCAACSRCVLETSGGKMCNIIEVDGVAVACTHEGTVFNPRSYAESETNQRFVIFGTDKWGRRVEQSFPIRGETTKCLRYSLCAYTFCRPIAKDTFPVCECAEIHSPPDSLKKFSWGTKNHEDVVLSNE